MRGEDDDFKLMMAAEVGLGTRGENSCQYLDDQFGC